MQKVKRKLDFHILISFCEDEANLKREILISKPKLKIPPLHLLLFGKGVL